MSRSLQSIIHASNHDAQPSSSSSSSSRVRTTAITRRRSNAMSAIVFIAIQNRAETKKTTDDGKSARAADEEEKVSEREWNQDFYQQWPNAKPADIIQFVEAKAVRGDAKSVLEAMDIFWTFYPTYNLGKTKQKILRDVEQKNRPKKLIEFGTFLGYSAIATCDELRDVDGFYLVCVEAEPLHAEVAVKLLKFSGFEEDRVAVITGSANAQIPKVKELLNKEAADQIFLDHCKPCLRPDLESLEEYGLVHKGTCVIADNVLYPGAPDYLAYLDANGYETELKKAPFEYDRSNWDKSWTPKEDAMSVSIKLV